MERFISKLLLIYFTALGILLGASLVGSLSAVFVQEPPVVTMLKLARDIKIWAIAAAIGGTFSTFRERAFPGGRAGGVKTDVLHSQRPGRN